MNGTAYFSSDLQALYWEIVLVLEALQKLKRCIIELNKFEITCVAGTLHVEADNFQPHFF
jgi:hypothetical protein